MKRLFKLNTENIDMQIASIYAFLKGFMGESKNYYVSIKEDSAEYWTERQRAFLFGWFYRETCKHLRESGIQIRLKDGRDLPITPENLHEILASMFLIKGETQDGKTIRWSITDIPRSRSNTEGKPNMGEYVDNCRHFIYEHWGFDVPPPPRGGEDEDYLNVIGGKWHG